jgi:hypothetical protein
MVPSLFLASAMVGGGSPSKTYVTDERSDGSVAGGGGGGGGGDDDVSVLTHDTRAWRTSATVASAVRTVRTARTVLSILYQFLPRLPLPVFIRRAFESADPLDKYVNPHALSDQFSRETIVGAVFEDGRKPILTAEERAKLKTFREEQQRRGSRR